MTTVELGRVKALCKCGSPYLTHEFTQGAVAWDNDACTGYEPAQDWPIVRVTYTGVSCVGGTFTGPGPAISPRPVVAQLLADVAAGIRVLVTRDGMQLTEEQISERAANIVAGLTGNFRIEQR